MLSKQHNLLRQTLDIASTICADLLDGPSLEAISVTTDTVPTERGIYIWRFIRDLTPAYIGVALGKNGLRQRILAQHLRSSYRKSVFRKAVVADTGVSLGQESVDFIRAHFTLAVRLCPSEDTATVKAAEALLIASLNPRYNKV